MGRSTLPLSRAGGDMTDSQNNRATGKLRMEGCQVIGPDGKVVCELTDGDIAGLIIAETFGQITKREAEILEAHREQSRKQPASSNR
jgi:hypothetical protein